MTKKIVSGTHLILLVSLLALLLRWYPIRGGLFTFQYDMAKDSLKMLEMFEYFDLSLVGPTTSIPGLFYGPLWYYLALIPNILLNFEPFASVLVVWVLVVLSLVLLYKYVGVLEAFIFAISSGLIGSQQNAWTPYMTSLLMVPLLVLLFAIKRDAKVRTHHLVAIAFVVSLFFHFQVAYGVVIVPITIFILLFLKPAISLKQFFLALVAFFSTLLPSFLFELKNNFLQTRSVIMFIENFSSQAQQIETNQKGLLKFVEVTTELLSVAANAVSPLHTHWVFGVLISTCVVLYCLKNKGQTTATVISSILVGTFLLYVVLPVKAYYLVAVFPVFLIAFAGFLKQSLPKAIPLFVVLCFIFSLLHMVNQRQTYLRLAETTNELYAPKKAAIQTAYTLAANENFASYHFVPQVYDYTYQFLYLNMIRTGAAKPTEFSYLPGEYLYTTYKHTPTSNEKTNVVILIVEEPQYQDVQDNWWRRLGEQGSIQKIVPISKALSVYKLVKK